MTDSSYVPVVPKDPCDHLTTIHGQYQHPFVNKTAILDGYEFKSGGWVVEVFNQQKEDVEDETQTRYVRLEFCPFCGKALHPAPYPNLAAMTEPVVSAEPVSTKEVESGPKKAKGPISK